VVIAATASRSAEVQPEHTWDSLEVESVELAAASVAGEPMMCEAMLERCWKACQLQRQEECIEVAGCSAAAGRHSVEEKEEERPWSAVPQRKRCSRSQDIQRQSWMVSVWS
jgi:hypothetical protein